MDYQIEESYILPIRYASFWARLAAYILDCIVTAIPIFIIKLIFSDAASEYPRSFSLLCNLIINWIYLASMESSKNQASLGKMALDLKVTDLSGNRISFGRATIRYFSQLISFITLFIGVLMIFWTEKKQGLHDMIAGTLVVSE